MSHTYIHTYIHKNETQAMETNFQASAGSMTMASIPAGAFAKSVKVEILTLTVRMYVCMYVCILLYTLNVLKRLYLWSIREVSEGRDSHSHGENVCMYVCILLCMHTKRTTTVVFMEHLHSQ